MKIFSSFNSNKKSNMYQEYKDEFWEDNVLLISKSKLFYWLFIIFPLVLFLGVLWVIIRGLIYFFQDINKILWYILSCWVLILMLWKIFFPLIKLYIDYKLDFAVITPNFMIRHNQEGIFNSNTKSFNIENMKSIYIDRKGFLWGLIYSILNNWNIVFMVESDKFFWESTISYVQNPEKVRDEIGRIMKII